MAEEVLLVIGRGWRSGALWTGKDLRKLEHHSRPAPFDVIVGRANQAEQRRFEVIGFTGDDDAVALTEFASGLPDAMRRVEHGVIPDAGLEREAINRYSEPESIGTNSGPYLFDYTVEASIGATSYSLLCSCSIGSVQAPLLDVVLRCCILTPIVGAERAEPRQ